MKNFKDLDKKQLQKYLEAKADIKDHATFRISRDLKNKFIQKLESEGFNKTDFFIKMIIKYIYDDQKLKTSKAGILNIFENELTVLAETFGNKIQCIEIDDFDVMAVEILQGK